jgi:hypothetical protein
MKYIIAFVVVLVVALPLSAVLTWMLSGFWDWFERHSGVESIGHSGPAEWCYWAVFSVVVLFVSAGTWLLMRPRKD